MTEPDFPFQKQPKSGLLKSYKCS